MTPDEFVQALKRVAAEDAVDSVKQVLKQPPGRRPDPRMVDLSQHYNQMDPTEQRFIGQTMELVARQAVFGVLAVLDGVRSVEGFGPKGEFQLYYQKGDERTRLNSPGGEMLHDIFNAS